MVLPALLGCCLRFHCKLLCELDIIKQNIAVWIMVWGAGVIVHDSIVSISVSELTYSLLLLSYLLLLLTNVLKALV